MEVQRVARRYGTVGLSNNHNGWKSARIKHKQHPRTVFVACHFANCCADLHQLAALLDRYPNLYADIGARFAEVAPIPRFMAKFFAQYQDRLLYGTDNDFDVEMYRTTFRLLETPDEHFYPARMNNYHWPWQGFGLPEPVLKKLYRENALRIFGKPSAR